MLSTTKFQEGIAHLQHGLSYCGQEVYRRDRDRFLACLFIDARHREAFFALCALHLELAVIHASVREEMIAHIRYAWWQEEIEKLYRGAPPPAQPVLRALASIIAEGGMPASALLSLMESHREHYPAAPPAVENAALMLLQALCPAGEPGWRKAGRIIATHRSAYGARYNGWLHLKLLAAGF